MSLVVPNLRRFEFEARIFISFGIVALVVAASFFMFKPAANTMEIVGRMCGIESRIAVRVGYLIVAIVMVPVTVLRMWSGSILSSRRMMAFRVQKDALITEGPYAVVRNPIYLADLVAFCAFAICLRPVGLLLPVLLFVHYARLVAYEEKALLSRFGERFSSYAATAPRFIPRIFPARRSARVFGAARITRDGVRNNALYLFFIPGFVAAALTGSLTWAIIIGAPGVLDWAIVHTRKGLPVREAGGGAT